MEGEDKRGRGREGGGQRSILLCLTCYSPFPPPCFPLPPPCFPPPSSMLPPSLLPASPLPPPCFPPPSSLLPPSLLPASPLPPPCFPPPSALLPPSVPPASPLRPCFPPPSSLLPPSLRPASPLRPPCFPTPSAVLPPSVPPASPLPLPCFPPSSALLPPSSEGWSDLMSCDQSSLPPVNITNLPFIRSWNSRQCQWPRQASLQPSTHARLCSPAPTNRSLYLPMPFISVPPLFPHLVMERQTVSVAKDDCALASSGMLLVFGKVHPEALPLFP
ncbi:unnamed protein product [Closterium sp. Yama58-4]|nr:unnamed protein product [Closterium sp. Yama58-4]